MPVASILETMRNTFLRPAAEAAEVGNVAWWHDPLTHPDIRAMDQRMLADLPFPALRRVPDRAAC